MSKQVVCPLSACSDNFKQCHPLCKLLKDGECLLALFLENTSATEATSNN